MIEYIEVNPLPEICQKCEEQQQRYFAADPEEQLRMEQEEDFNCDCGSCEYAGARWILPREEELWLLRKAKIKAIQRLQRDLSMIDTELAEIMDQKRKEKGGA